MLTSARAAARAASRWVAKPVLSAPSAVPARGLPTGTRLLCTTAPAENINVTFLGGGKMAEAIIAGLRMVDQPYNISAVDPKRKRRDFLRSHYQVDTFENVSAADEVLKESKIIVLSVKPQQVTDCFEEMEGLLEKENPDCIIVSIVAGLGIKDIQEKSGIKKIARCMPNTPATVQEGMTVWTPSKAIDKSEKKLLGRFFDSIGEEEAVSDEDMLDIATAVCGSGPAYILLCMESMIEAAVGLGISREIATRLTKQTVLGTAVHAIKSDSPVSVLRNDITSPGGTTARALYMLERGGFRTVVSDCIWAAFRRSRELGKKKSDIGPLVNR